MALDHHWVEYKMTTVDRVVDLETGQVQFIADPTLEPDVVYGCVVCNMGQHEAAETSCPGFDMFEEANARVN